MNKKISALVLLVLVILPACKNQHMIEEANVDSEDFLISTSMYPVYFLASQVVKEKAEVVNITPSSVEPHDYEPTPYDIEVMMDSDLLLVNGNLEPWLEDVEGSLKQNGVAIMALTKNMDLMEEVHVHDDEDNEHEQEEEEEEEEEEAKDPHVWLDPILVIELVDLIANEVSTLDPVNAEFYEANALVLKEELKVLSANFSETLKSCAQNTFVTSHAAFAYLAKRYGLSQLPISGLSPEDEPSAAEMAEVVEFVKANDVKVIFFESLVSPSLSEAIASEVGAETLVLNPIEGLTEEELMEGKNYFTVMDQNLENLKVALECK